jgi:hypothetical protein
MFNKNQLLKFQTCKNNAESDADFEWILKVSKNLTKKFEADNVFTQVKKNIISVDDFLHYFSWNFFIPHLIFFRIFNILILFANSGQIVQETILILKQGLLLVNGTTLNIRE